MKTTLSRRLVEQTPPKPGVKILIGTDLMKIYPKTKLPALRNLNISVNEGEIYGLLGPNGAGKTTAISIMSTTMQPTGGSVFICGIDGLKYPSRVKRLIGLVPQDIALYPDLTVRENLKFFGRMYGLRGPELEKRIQESLELVCLEEKTRQRVGTCSGGMKRRANLAVGVLHRPRILFLDEPTVGIDAQSRNMIMERLLELKAFGITMVYTTHYMEEAEKICNRVAIMDEGRIVEQGPPEKLIRKTPDCLNLGEVFLAMTGKQLRD
jgi:ABC-2 type transport system ATP-binding protein